MIFSARQISKGFTLIEMVVVVGIMGILLLVGVASYGKMNDRAKVEQAAVTLSTQLRTWQKKAESGVGSELCGNEKYDGNYVVWANQNKIHMKVVCGGEQTGDPEVFKIPNDCLVDDFGWFILKPLGLGVSSAKDITIVNPKIASISYTVSLSLSGGIDVKKN